MVKNRRKNGDHYWVRANATPINRNGQVTGYMSVRTKPSRSEIKAAKDLYCAIREGKARGPRFHKGIVVRSGPMAWTSALKVMSVGWRVRAGLIAAAIAGVVATSTFGLSGGALSGFALTTVAITAIVAVWLHAQIVHPLQEIKRQAQAVAAGQAAANINMDRVDEIGMIMRSVNQAGLNLVSLCTDVGEQVAGLHSASGEIAQGNANLSSRTEQAAPTFNKPPHLWSK